MTWLYYKGVALPGNVYDCNDARKQQRSTEPRVTEVMYDGRLEYSVNAAMGYETRGKHTDVQGISRKAYWSNVSSQSVMSDWLYSL